MTDFLGRTWPDDSSFACVDADPRTLINKTRTLVAAVTDQCAKRGLVPNCKPGKTSIIMNLHGKGSRKAQLDMFGQGDITLQVQAQCRGVLSIPIVKTYIHLGCAVEKGMTPCAESYRRGAIAASAFEPLRPVVFQNVSIPATVRGRLLTVFFDSMFFNLDVWRGEDDQGWKRLVLGHQLLTKRVLAKDVAAEELRRLAPAEVACILAHPPLKIVHRSQRLRVLISLLRLAPPVLWALVKLLGEGLLQDLQWLCEHDVGPWPPVDEAHWPCWWHRIQEAPDAFRRAIGRTVDAATLCFF